MSYVSTQQLVNRACQACTVIPAFNIPYLPMVEPVVEALKAGKKAAGDGVRVMSSPTAGGKKRGAHNCGECNAAFLKAIDAFSFSQDVGEFEALDCDCRATYDAVLEMEPATFTALDMERWV